MAQNENNALGNKNFPLETTLKLSTPITNASIPLKTMCQSTSSEVNIIRKTYYQ